MKKIIMIQASILTTTLFFNTGCFFGSLNNPVVEKNKPQKKINPTEQTQQVPNPLLRPPPSVECTNDINSPSGCQKKPISAKELKPKKVSTEGQEVHKLKSLQGQAITIIDRKNGFIFPQYANKVVILQMFGKNCSHCIKEIPIMRKLHRKYKGKLEVIAVQVEDKMTAREAKYLLKKHHIKYPVIPGENATNLQYNIQSTYGWTGILPYTLVVKNGVTEFTYPGAVGYKEINKDIQSIIR
jgi:thiol-disulfide isomerase/thioredoxin